MTAVDLAAPPVVSGSRLDAPGQRRVFSPAFWAGVALGLAAALLTATSVVRYLNGHGSLDLAHFDQGLWHAARGEGSFSTIFGFDLLEDHFGPGIFIFAGLYRLVATPIWLLLAQGVAVWAAGWQIVRRLGPTVGWRRAGTLGVLLLLSPPVAFALFWDAHPIVYAVPLALAGVFAVNEGRPRRAIVFGVAAALFRPDAAFGVLAAMTFFPGEDRRRRLWPGLGLLAYVAFATYMEQTWGDSGSHWEAYYGHLGAAPTDALRNPGAIFSSIISPGAVGKALPWLATAGFLCFRRPRLMAPAVAVGLPTLLAGWGGTFFWGFHYGILPAFLLAPAWIPLVRERPERSRLIVVGILAISMVGSPFTPLPLVSTGAAPAPDFWFPHQERLCITEDIPPEAGVSTVALGYLAHRDHLFLWPRPFRAVPEGTSASPYLMQPDPDLAAQVDYIIRSRKNTSPPPDGFVVEASTVRYERLRRAATTAPAALECSSQPT